MSVHRVATVTLVVLAAAAAGSGLVTLDLALRGSDRAPSLTECIEDWNARAGAPQRDRVASGAFSHAVVSGWLAKLEYPGCTVTFVTDSDRSWLSCTRTFEAADARLTRWSCEGGPHVGRGRARDLEVHPNAVVVSDRRLVVERSSDSPDPVATPQPPVDTFSG